jgi:hypothetical protein
MVTFTPELRLRLAKLQNTPHSAERSFVLLERPVPEAEFAAEDEDQMMEPEVLTLDAARLETEPERFKIVPNGMTSGL